jgi:hypothetical protein
MTYNKAWLVALFKRKARRPTTDGGLDDTSIYRYLAIGQERAYERIAMHKPEVLYGARTLMVTTDAGLSYRFGVDADAANITPMGHVEVYASANAAYPLRPGPSWDANADYIHDGAVIRFPLGRARLFPAGPYFRGVLRPAEISASQEPTLVPLEARLVIVLQALVEWAEEDGARDPEPFQKAVTRFWSGSPDDPTDQGFIGRLKTMNAFDGASAESSAGGWWRGIDTGAGYLPDLG